MLVKKVKSFILLSKSCKNTNIDKLTIINKPETILCYNNTKSKVYIIKKMLALVLVRRFNHRLPIIVFFNMIDILNAFLLYKSVLKNKNKIRQNF